jgi:putative ABC transport system permease protein
VCIVLLTAATTLLITGGTWLGLSLRNGAESTRARLGADAIAIPQSSGDSLEGALLMGSPSTFYLSADTAERIALLDGVERATPQLFISSFDSDHCAALVQIIGYDPATDFVVTPWLVSSDVAQPQYGEVVIGGNLYNLKLGGKMPLFSVELNVVGVLDKTGMGFDNSVFVDMETARMLLAEYEKYQGAQPLPEGLGTQGVVSAVLLDIDDGFDSLAFQRSVNLGFRDEGVRLVASQSIVNDASKNLGLIAGILGLLISSLWILALFVLAVIFTLALDGRRREFGILRAVGATRGRLSAIIITESALLCGAGATIAIGAVCLVVFPYGELIERAMQAAYLPPASGAAAGLFAACLLLGASVGPLASLLSAVRIGRDEAFANIMEGG